MLVETLTAAALIAAPFVLPHLDFAPATVNRILVWGLFGIGFDILFGFTGLLSFGQSAFFGTGGMVAAYLLTMVNFPYVIPALFIGMIVAAVVGYLIGLIALRRTGIYFAMITVAIAEIFYFVEFNPLSAFTGGENGLPGVPTPTLKLGFTTLRIRHRLVALWVPGILLFRRHRAGAAHRALAGRRNPERDPRQPAARRRRRPRYPRATSTPPSSSRRPMPALPAACSAMMQGFMPPDAFTFDTSGQLVMQTAIGGAGTLFGPLVGAAVWLYLSDFFQTTLHLGATWKLVLGVVFVLLVCFLRRGIVGGIQDLYVYAAGRNAPAVDPNGAALERGAVAQRRRTPPPPRPSARPPPRRSGTVGRKATAGRSCRRAP